VYMPAAYAATIKQQHSDNAISKSESKTFS
jgi:hypothetical protein